MGRPGHLGADDMIPHLVRCEERSTVVVSATRGLAKIASGNLYDPNQ